jgi:hypothetical protein
MKSLTELASELVSAQMQYKEMSTKEITETLQQVFQTLNQLKATEISEIDTGGGGNLGDAPENLTERRKVMSIIQKQTIHLDEHFDVIKGRIKSNEKFSNLNEICSFNDQQRSLTFKTEKIHPADYSSDTKPVILLFSNPHPVSVYSGMFLSEPRSRSFWKRLFSCNCLNPNPEMKKAIYEWSDDTIRILTQHLLAPTYSKYITLFFDCLEALPTNQYLDLGTLIPNIGDTRGFRRQILQTPGKEQLTKISEQNNINSWIVFSVEAYRNIVGDNNIGKYAPERIPASIDNYIENHDNKLFWDQLSDLKHTITVRDKKITVYLSLIARYKELRTPKGGYYFTVMLDQIFNDIINNKKLK